MAASTYVLLIAAAILTTAHAQGKKNVLLIFGDDAGFQMGAYNNTAIQTPNWDALATRSVVFKHGYTSVSSCSPSRSVLLTGQPQHQNGQYGLAQSVMHFSSFDNVQSLPVILSQHGVRTGIIGKKHVEPDSVYKFEFDASSEVFNIQQVGRNITFMKEKVRQFLQVNDSRPFFLYVAFHDPHRNPAVADKVGQFMEKWGDGQPGHGIIPDWTPVHYDPADVIVPYFLPDTTVTRSELANMYTTYSRMDQGIGLFMKELEAAGYLDDTLVMYTSDNGIPYPNAKTNLYEPGMGEPMMISNPMNKQHWGKYTDALASTMDFTPTILDWFGISAKKLKVTLTGKSLLPVTADPTNVTNYQRAFSSHNFHEVTMNYPMRVVRTPQYRLLHNLNHKSPFGLATDLYQAPTFQDILNKTRLGQSTGWFKTLDQYYYRDQWELYDIIQDPQELKNLASDPAHANVLQQLQAELLDWQTQTSDPWRCLPSAILEGDVCFDADNEEAS
ncbi:hypothetical protein BaRGS_00030485 [Batillaria attramentaria]|uniref:Sulfatase N-terminal domain-containing protein n=1 Tax=Batillaria attramentaria TaxID=370345 RepID=A0ABD0JTF2_9CAEN